MKGYVIAEEAHVVNIIPPVDITGGKVSQAFSMANYQHATIIIQIGVQAAAIGAITVQCGAATAALGTPITSPTVLPFSLYLQETAGANNDVLSGRTAETTSGYTPSTHGTGVFYVIELDAAELDAAGGSYVQLAIANTTNSAIASAVAILSGSRYAERQSPTVTT